MGYIIGAIILWLVVRALKRAAATSKQARDLQEQHSPTRGHTTTERSTGARATAGSFLDPVSGQPRVTGITDHKGPFLQFRR